MQIKEPQDHSIREEKNPNQNNTIYYKNALGKINAVLCHNLRDLTTLFTGQYNITTLLPLSYTQPM